MREWPSYEDSVIASHFSGGAGELVFWSFRYFLGRQTAATVNFANQLANSWVELPVNIKKSIEKELEEAFKEAEKIQEGGSPFGSPLGHDCDRAAWELVRIEYKKEKADAEIFCDRCNMQKYNCLCSHDDDDGC